MFLDAFAVTDYPKRSFRGTDHETVFMVKLGAFRIRLKPRNQVKVYYRLLQNFGMGVNPAFIIDPAALGNHVGDNLFMFGAGLDLLEVFVFDLL